MKDVVTMAGFFASHAVWSVSGGDELIPLMGALKENGTRDMTRLTSNPASANELAERDMSDMSDADVGMALIQDGFVTLDIGKTDALVVIIRFKQDSERRIQLVIPYRHASHDRGFAIHKVKVSALDGFGDSDTSWIIGAFFDGLESHEKGRDVWKRHYEATPVAENPDKPTLSVELSTHEFNVLKRAPFLVFYYVATADGDVTKKEMMAFLKVLSGERLFQLPLLDFLIQGVQPEVQMLIKEMATQEVDYTGELGVIKLIVDARLTTEKAKQFKDELYDMGLAIAEATGGFMGLGAKVGKEEAAALDSIAASLGLLPS